MVATMSLMELLYKIFFILAFVLAFFSKDNIIFAYISVILALLNLYLFVVSIPLMMNWSKNLYSYLIRKIFLYAVWIVLLYSIIFYSVLNISFVESLKISLASWTTIGYTKDFSSMASILMYLEAFSSLLTFPILAALMWLYVESRLWKDSFEEKKVLEKNKLLMEIDSDSIYGGFVERETEKTAREEKARLKLLSPCVW